MTACGSSSSTPHGENYIRCNQMGLCVNLDFGAHIYIYLESQVACKSSVCMYVYVSI